MIVSCEKCGKQYEIDSEQIKGEKAQFQCESCQNVVTVLKQAESASQEVSPKPLPPETKKNAPPVSGPRKTRLGLRPKMFFLFFFVPIALVIAASFLYLNHMKSLTSLITKESSQVVTRMAEESIAEKSRAVAKEIKLYLDAHPDLKKEDFHKDPAFMKIAVQNVGVTGYTVVITAPTDTEPGVIIWAHPKKGLIGVDIFKALRKKVGEKLFAPFEKAHLQAFRTRREADGYYRFLDERDKYMVISNVEDTNFFIPTTTYVDEFTLPMADLETRVNTLTEQARRTMMIVLAATAFLIALVVLVYSYRVSGRLKSLSSAADRISVGNLDVEIEGTKSRDEIGILANDLSRMQTSIRLAIKRLRERR